MGIAAALVLVIALAFFGVVRIDPVVVAEVCAQSVIIGAAVLYFAGVFVFGRLDGDEKRSGGPHRHPLHDLGTTLGGI